MSRLNVWHRLGIVASLVWYIGAGIYELNRHDTRTRQWVNASYELCLEFQRDPAVEYRDCSAELSQNLQIGNEDALAMSAFFAAVPIPIAWVIVYVILWTGRWVWRGREIKA